MNETACGEGADDYGSADQAESFLTAALKVDPALAVPEHQTDLGFRFFDVGRSKIEFKIGLVSSKCRRPHALKANGHRFVGIIISGNLKFSDLAGTDVVGELERGLDTATTELHFFHFAGDRQVIAETGDAAPEVH